MASVQHQTISHNSTNPSTPTSPTSAPSSSSPSDEMLKTDNINDFIRTGRTGRRNAVPDLLIDPNLNLTTSKLTELMYKIDFKDTD